MSEGELKQYIEKLNGSEGVCRISCINAADVRLVLRRGLCYGGLTGKCAMCLTGIMRVSRYG